VSHAVFESELDAYLDGELADDDARALEAHLARCPECVRFRDERLELRAAIAAKIPAFQAPDALRKRVLMAAESSAARPRAVRPFTVRRWSVPLALAASLTLVAVGTWRLTAAGAARQTLTTEVLGSHVRSLMPGHLTDVLSTDQHTVKPWFNGKLDYSPPVYDFAGRGYPLVGGRLDYIGGRSVAALVYGRRQHLINVFLWPTAHGPSGGPSISTSQGYHLLHWTTDDYSYWAVSDLGLPELEDFASLLRKADAAANAPN
jgi:anti-sigma factor (TIGR02949 family)